MMSPFYQGFVGAVVVGACIGVFIALMMPHPSPAVVPVQPQVPDATLATSTFADELSSTSTYADHQLPALDTGGKPLGALPAPTPSTPVVSAPTPVVDHNASCDTLLANNPFYADPARQVARTLRDLEKNNRDEEAALLKEIACAPSAVWLSGRSKQEVTAVISRTAKEATANGKIVVYALYNVPDHYNASWHSSLPSGGYLEWIEYVAQAIGTSEAWIIVEPDALPMSMAYSPADREKRLLEIRSAVNIFKTEAPNARVYLDIGHNHWLSIDEATTLLQSAGIANAHGFSLNVSNYQTTSAVREYGARLSARVSGKPFVIDTARNGNGPSPDNEWCNAPGRAIGSVSQLLPNDSIVDALLWIKPPGESDGQCNGGPTAGVFWLDYALNLVRNAR